jgi:hypothetical protein
MCLLFLWLFFQLLPVGPAGAQQSSSSDAEAYARLQQRLTQSQQAMAQFFSLPDARIPPEALRDLERLNGDIEASYFRDLAERSRMLLFVVREEAALEQSRIVLPEIGEMLLREAAAERGRRILRKGSAVVFWGSLGAGLLSLGGSYALWYASERFDRRYLSTQSPGEAALLKAWSSLADTGSYALAGIGTLSLVIALPALAGARPR